MTHEEKAKSYCILASFPSIIPGTLSQKQIRFVLTWFVLDKPALAITHLPVVLSVFTSSLFDCFLQHFFRNWRNFSNSLVCCSVLF